MHTKQALGLPKKSVTAPEEQQSEQTLEVRLKRDQPMATSQRDGNDVRMRTGQAGNDNAGADLGGDDEVDQKITVLDAQTVEILFENVRKSPRRSKLKVPKATNDPVDTGCHGTAQISESETERHLK